MSVNDISRIVIDKPRVMLEIVASLTYDSRGVIHNRNMFIVQVNCDTQFVYDIKVKITAKKFCNIGRRCETISDRKQRQKETELAGKKEGETDRQTKGYRERQTKRGRVRE